MGIESLIVVVVYRQKKVLSIFFFLAKFYLRILIIKGLNFLIVSELIQKIIIKMQGIKNDSIQIRWLWSLFIGSLGLRI